MHRWVFAVLLATAPRLAGQDSQARLASRIPPAVRPGVYSLLTQATREGLPIEPLIQKALEGGAKGAAPDQIVQAVGVSLIQLRSARALVQVAREARPIDPLEVTAVAAALSRGVTSQLAARLTAALPGEPMGPALHAVADLAGHGFAEDSAVELIVEAAREGLRGLRLLDVAAAAVQELQRGHSHALALTRVRGLLPNLPPPPRPGPAAVSGARRVQHTAARP